MALPALQQPKPTEWAIPKPVIKTPLTSPLEL